MRCEGGRSGDPPHLLTTHQPEIWSFFLSFGVIARLWLAQHQAVRPLLVANDWVTGLLAWVIARNDQITDGEGLVDARVGVLNSALLLLALDTPLLHLYQRLRRS